MRDTQTLFLSGMRRSGTTIVLDALASDPNSQAIYEPLAAARSHAQGGGSGVTETDYFEHIRNGRQAFLKQHPELTWADFNYGAPTNPLLEYATDLPDLLRTYLKSLADQTKTNIYKFTRMHHKLGDLKHLCANGALVLVVRDPRAVVTSYLYGKGQKHRAEFADPQQFFVRKSDYSAWNSGPFFEYLSAQQPYQSWRNCADFLKVLLLWWDNVTTSIQAAHRHFEGRWFLLRHHDFCCQPQEVLEALYDATGISASAEAMAWARHHVRARQDIHEPDSPYWAEAFVQFSMQDFLAEHTLLKQKS